MVRPKVSMTSPSTGKYPSAGGMAETTRSDGGRSSELLFRPPAHLPEARAPVVRDAFENLEGRGAVVSAGLQRLHDALPILSASAAMYVRAPSVRLSRCA